MSANKTESQGLFTLPLGFPSLLLSLTKHEGLGCSAPDLDFPLLVILSDNIHLICKCTFCPSHNMSGAMTISCKAHYQSLSSGFVAPISSFLQALFHFHLGLTKSPSCYSSVNVTKTSLWTLCHNKILIYLPDRLGVHFSTGTSEDRYK